MQASDGYSASMTARRTRAIPALIVLAIAMLVGAGCGDDTSDAKYEAGLKKVAAQLAEASEASKQASQSPALEDRQAALGEAHAALESAATTAAALKPPDEVESVSADLVSALRDYAALFEQLATLEAGDSRETQLYSEAGEIVARLEKANRALAKAGFEVDDDAASDDGDAASS